MTINAQFNLAKALNAALSLSKVAKTVQERRVARARAKALEESEGIIKSLCLPSDPKPHTVLCIHARQAQLLASEMEKLGVIKSEVQLAVARAEGFLLAAEAVL